MRSARSSSPKQRLIQPSSPQQRLIKPYLPPLCKPLSPLCRPDQEKAPPQKANEPQCSPRKKSAIPLLCGFFLLLLGLLSCTDGKLEPLPLYVEAEPAGGSIAPGQTITLRTQGDAAIFYTLDGRDPNPQDALRYEAPIPLWSSLRLRFVAADDQGRKGVLGEATYLVDTLFAQSWSDPPAGNYRDPLEIRLYSDKEARIHYTTDGSLPNENSPLYQDPLQIKDDTFLRFFSIDNVGNREPIQEVFYNFPPLLSLVPSSGVYRAKDLQITLKASQEGRQEYKLFDGNWTRYRSPLSLESDAALQARAFDDRNLLSEIAQAYYGVMEPMKRQILREDHAIRPQISAMIDPEGLGRPAWLLADARRLLLWREEGGRLAQQPKVLASDGQSPAERLRIWDMDGDGLADILVRRAEGWAFWRSLGQDRYQRDDGYLGILLSPRLKEILPADMDGDGQLDLLLLYDDPPQYRILRREGRRYTPFRDQIAGIPASSRLLASDLNGDGLADLLVLPEEGAPFLLWNLGNGQFEYAALQGALPGLSGMRWRHAARADIDLDGDLDLILIGEGIPEKDAPLGASPPPTPLHELPAETPTFHLIVLHQVGGRGWRFTSRHPLPLSSFYALHWVDLDGDPFPDLLLIDKNQQHYPWKNIQGRSWLPANPAAAWPQKALPALAIGDLGATGQLSVLLQAPDSNTLLRYHADSNAPSIRIALRGIQGNRHAIGAKMRLRFGSRLMLREIGFGTTSPDQADLFPPIPLGSFDPPQQIDIIWNQQLERSFPTPPTDRLLLLSPQSP